MTLSFVFLFISLLLLRVAGSLYTATPGLVLLGAGLAAGFPVMLGITGDRFKELSGTAFSFVMTVALTGNMLVNYMMGLIAGKYGISNLTIVAFIEMSLQVILFLFIIGSLKINHK
jgi:MFS family permease